MLKLSWNIMAVLWHCNFVGQLIQLPLTNIQDLLFYVSNEEESIPNIDVDFVTYDKKTFNLVKYSICWNVVLKYISTIYLLSEQSAVKSH